MRSLLWGLLIFGPALHSVAASEPSVRSPGDMTVEERAAIVGKMNAYHRCVYEAAMARVDAVADVRQAADEGLAACTDTADALSQLIESYRFGPDFAGQFVQHARRQAVHALLPELAMRKSGH